MKGHLVVPLFILSQLGQKMFIPRDRLVAKNGPSSLPLPIGFAMELCSSSYQEADLFPYIVNLG